MTNYFSVKTHDELLNLINPQEGMVVYCEEDSKMYHRSEDEWRLVESNSEDGLKMSLYDINKTVISQLPPLTEDKLSESAKMINKWRPSDICMLYGQEISYFTVFKQEKENVEFSNFGEGVIELIKEITEKIYSIEMVNENSAVEIWAEIKGMTTVLYLFDAAQCIVTFGE